MPRLMKKSMRNKCRFCDSDYVGSTDGYAQHETRCANQYVSPPDTYPIKPITPDQLRKAFERVGRKDNCWR